MISDKLLRKLEKTVSKTDMARLSEISIMQGQDGSYFLFNKYTIRKNNDCYIVIKDYVAETKSFNILKNAVAWCTFDKRNMLYQANRILKLDNLLAGIEVDISLHTKIFKNAKNTDDRLIVLSKLSEDKLKKRRFTDELYTYINDSKKWQTKRFDTKP